MFRNNVEVFDPIPKEYLDQFKRPLNSFDYALDVLGLALLKPRIENYNGIEGVFCNYESLQAAVEDCKPELRTQNPQFYYITFENNSEDVDFSAFKDFTRFTRFEEYLKKNADRNAVIFYHETENIVYIFIDSRQLNIYHLCLFMLSKYYPALFKAHPLTEKELILTKTLSKTDREAFQNEIMNNLGDLTEVFKKIRIASLIRQFHQNKIDVAKKDLAQIESMLRDVMEQYANYSKQRKEKLVWLTGLNETENETEEEKEIVEYLSTNSKIHDVKIQDGRIKFSVATEMMQYNPDAYEIYAKKGYIFDGHYNEWWADMPTLTGVFAERDNRKLLLDHIFNEDPDYRIKLCGNYELNMNDNEVGTNSDYRYVGSAFEDCLPNPHLRIHRCLGGYEEKIMNALYNNELMSALELCVYSAGSVDLDETEQTFRPLIGWLCTTQKKCLLDRDGNSLTPEEAIVQIKDKEKENEADCAD